MRIKLLASSAALAIALALPAVAQQSTTTETNPAAEAHKATESLSPGRGSGTAITGSSELGARSAETTGQPSTGVANPTDVTVPVLYSTDAPVPINPPGAAPVGEIQERGNQRSLGSPWSGDRLPSGFTPDELRGAEVVDQNGQPLGTIVDIATAQNGTPADHVVIQPNADSTIYYGVEATKLERAQGGDDGEFVLNSPKDELGHYTSSSDNSWRPQLSR